MLLPSDLSIHFCAFFSLYLHRLICVFNSTMTNCASYLRPLSVVDLLHFRGLGRSGEWRRTHGIPENNKSELYSAVLSSANTIQNLKLAQIIAGHVGCVNTVLFTEDGTLAITGSDDMTIQLHNIYTNELKLKIPTSHRGNIFDAKEIPDSDCHQFLSCAGFILFPTYLHDFIGDGRVLLTTIPDNSAQTTKMLFRHRGRSHKIKFLPTDSNVFYSCGEDGYCFLHDLRDPSYLPLQSAMADIPIRKNCIEYQNGLEMRCSIYSIDINPLDPHQVAIGGDSYCAKLFDTRNLSTSESLTNPIAEYFSLVNNFDRHYYDYYGISGLQFHGNGREILVSYNSDHIYRFDLLAHNRRTPPNETCSTEQNSPESDYLTVYKGHMNRETIKQVTYWSSPGSLSFPHSSACQDYVISGSDSGHIWIWNRESGAIVKVLIGSKQNPVNCITPHKDLPLIASSGIERTVKLWYPHGDSAWLNHQIPYETSEFMSERDRIEAEIVQETEERRVEREFVTMLMARSRVISSSDSESESDSDSESDSESDSDEEDIAGLLGSSLQDQILSSEDRKEDEENDLPGTRRRSHSEMERGTHEISSSDQEEKEEGEERRQRQVRLRRFLVESYDRLSELDRAACLREGVSEESDSDIYEMESGDEELIEASSDEDDSDEHEEDQIESDLQSESSDEEIVDPDLLCVSIEEREEQDMSALREIEYEEVD
jgi:DDB1- and CUL4-associated factor 8